MVQVFLKAVVAQLSKMCLRHNISVAAVVVFFCAIVAVVPTCCGLNLFCTGIAACFALSFNVAAALARPQARRKVLLIGVRCSNPAFVLQQLFNAADSVVALSATARTWPWLVQHVGLSRLALSDYISMPSEPDPDRLMVLRCCPRYSTSNGPQPLQFARKQLVCNPDKVPDSKVELQQQLEMMTAEVAVRVGTDIQDVLDGVAAAMKAGSLVLALFQSNDKLRRIRELLQLLQNLRDSHGGVAVHYVYERTGYLGSGASRTVEEVLHEARQHAAAGKVVFIMSVYG